MAGAAQRRRRPFLGAAWLFPIGCAAVTLLERYGAAQEPCRTGVFLEGELEIVGTIARFQAEGHDSVGYWIARRHWGKGIASQALAMFLAEEPRRPLHATTARTNAASRHILEKHGFRCTGFRMGEETDRYLAREIADFVLV